ncbi:transcription factor Cph2p [[Candida] anglica]
MATFSDYQPVYEFDATDDFLQSLSGAVPSLSPVSMTGDDSQVMFGVPENNQNNYVDQVDYMNPNFGNPNIPNMTNDANGVNYPTNPIELFPEFNNNGGQSQVMYQSSNSNEYSPTVEDERKSSPMSTTNSFSHSSSNGLTPVSQNSISSTHTSPVSVHVKREEDRKPIPTPQSVLVPTPSESSTTSGGVNVTNSKITKPGKKDRCSHNMIEKKYRTNINSKILALRDAVPSLRIATGDSKDISLVDLEGLTPASKLNKASVLTKATEYIKHLEKKNEVLRRQNLELQRIIQEANCNSKPPTPPQGFGYVPPMNEQSFNTTVNPMHQQQHPQPQLQQQHQHQQQMYGGNFVYANQQGNVSPGLSGGQKVLLGGLATVMGSSMFSGDNDFKGLSALPFYQFLPRAVAHPSPMVVQGFSLVKTLILFGAIANIVYPHFISSFADKTSKKTTKSSNILIWKDFLLVNLGLQLPHIIDPQQKSEILSMLVGGSTFSYPKLFNNYILLSSAELTFENCLLNLVVGKLLITKFPLLKTMFNYNLSMKASLISNLEQKGGDEFLVRLNKMIHNIDGVSIFGSDLIFNKLINVVEGKPINYNCRDGSNRLKYVELYQRQSSNIYGILFSWRVLELTHQLNVKYLDNVASTEDEDTKKEVFENIYNDTESINVLMDGCTFGKLNKYFKLFKAVIIPDEYAIELKESIQKDIETCLGNFKGLAGESELTDSDTLGSYDDSSREDSFDEEFGEDVAKSFAVNEKTGSGIASQKSLISSLSLITEEEFVVLTSSLVLYYHNRNVDQAKKLLGHLCFRSENTELSFLSFTAILRVIMALSSDDCQHDEILDKLVRIVRVWLNDKSKNNVLDLNTRGSLSDLVVEKGMVINGISESEDEDN